MRAGQRTAQHRRARRLGQVADVLLWTAAIAAPLAVGSVWAWAQQLLLALITTAWMCTCVQQALRGRRISLTAIAALPALAAALCALQLLPLPRGWIAVLSPKADEILQMTLGALGAYSSHPLSLDPPATAVELGKALTYTLLLLLAYQRSRERGGPERLVAAVAWSGVAALIISVVQTVSLLKTPFGLDLPGGQNVLVSTFVNGNHAAAFFGLTAFAATAVALSRKQRAQVILWGVAAVTLAAAVALTLSRGGILAFCLAALFCCWLLYGRTRRGVRRSWPLQLGVALAVGVVMFLAYTPVVRELATLQPGALQKDKSYLWRESLSMVPSFPWTGIGRGAFGRVYTVFKTNDVAGTFLYAESTPIQLLVDYGLVFGGVLLVLGVACCGLYVRNAWLERRAAAVCGLFFVGLHNCIDFNLELPGVAVPALLLAASLTDRHRSRAHPSTGVEDRAATEARNLSRRPWVLASRAAPLILPTLFLTVAAAYALWFGHRYSGRDITTALTKATSPIQHGQLAVAGLRRHPSDFFYTLSIARAELARPEPDLKRVLRWLNRTMILNPTFAGTHILAAQTLWQMGARDQALEEWRRTITLRPSLLSQVLDDIFQRGIGFPEAAKGVPDDLQLELCKRLRRGPDKAMARTCVGQVLAAGSEEVETMWTAFAWAATDKEIALATQLATRLQLAHPDHWRAPLAAGELAKLQGDLPGAEARWLEGLRAHPRQVELASGLFHLALAQHRYQAARGYLDHFRAQTTSRNLPSIARCAYLSGILYQAQGQHAKALHDYDRARQLMPRSLQYILAAAQAEERIGYRHRALESYRAASDLEPGREDLRAKVQTLELTLTKELSAERMKGLITEP